MDIGYHKISHIPFKVFFDKDAIKSEKRLPSERRNIDIITGIHFGKLLEYIRDKKEKDIKSWLYNNEKKLNQYLEKKKNIWKKNEHDKYCKHLNYILDFALQAANKFDKYTFFNLSHEFDLKSIRIIERYSSSKCLRNLNNLKDENLYIKKIMYDLFDDIEYMSSDQNILSGKHCSKMINRIKYRWGILNEIRFAVNNESIFTFDNNCTISIINDKLQALKCNNLSTPPQTGERTGAQPLSPLPSVESGLLESGGTEDGKHTLDVEDPLDVEHSIDDKDTEPKLDTTYAAASLAGISLFGTILYKYGPFRNRFNSRRGAINGSNIFPIDNHVYDANTMNNFEYLQTGITNDEYQVGYGSVTDY
ncbi:hypothetical protein PVMG_06106 [Plasmodium vivax Mauritania I]|uniref:VIR protein n=1 Tax=Plasmodium vivax Mauritania I TaxID=1035515 RepID=A0A0J9TKB2_PLAVI|nr:hypothetical protein PVMG_06106 [Plasmodium vivax Mauritania I]